MVEDALKSLQKLVEDHYAGASEPLYLATAGQRLGELRTSLVEQFRSLAGAVKHLGTDKLDLIIPAGKPGSAIVVTPEVRESIAARFGGGEAKAAGPASSFSTLPFPVQVAFCVKTEPGETVAIRVAAPIRYSKQPAAQPPPAGYIIVEPKYRSPGLKLANASITDLERLWVNFSQWASDHEVNPERIGHSAAPANALERFLAVQDPSVASAIVLPADIVAILLRHS